MSDGLRTERNDINWIITDDLESLQQYVIPFNLGTLRPLSDIFPDLTPEEIARNGLLDLSAKRREVLFRLPQEVKEQTTFYTVLPEKEWAEMKHDLTKPKPVMSRTLRGLKSGESWVTRWMQVHHLPTAMSFIMTNSAIVNADTFWEMRLSNTDVWRRLMAEHVPPTHHFARRSN